LRITEIDSIFGLKFSGYFCMPTKSQKRRLGIFIFLVIILLAALLLIIGTRQFLEEQDTYLIAYKDISVSGLDVGSPVKYLGLGVGSIKNIRIDIEDISKIIIEIAVKSGTPIKKDAYADIEMLGITGLKMIEIRGGSSAADLLEPGEYIQAGKSSSELITGKAEVIMEKIELLINNLNQFSKPENLNEIINLAKNANRSFEDFDVILRENRQELRDIIAQAQVTGARLDTITQLLVPKKTTTRQASLSDTLNEILSNINKVANSLKTANMGLVIEELAVTLDRTNRILNIMDHDLERGRDNIFISLRKLRSTLEYLDETARMVNEDPSILLRGTEYEDLPDDDLDR
jgi:ABC-type transporter Mla subunit MlaD